MKLALVALALTLGVACGRPTPPARTSDQRSVDTAPALAALRASLFTDAEHAAATTLALDPKNAQAAAIHAIATYQQAGEQVVNELRAVLELGDKLDALDHERGRAAWQAFLDKLELVDRDLAVVAADPEFSLELCLACWEHDWNHNGQVDDRDRKLLEIEYDGSGAPLPDGDPRRRPTFRFDVGDADWARAMVAFQRAFVELVLAYKWSELDKLFADDRKTAITLHLADASRVRRARELVLAGVGYADRSRREYLAETDDDREWVPNPRQKSHPVPLAVDDALYSTWADVTGDVRRLMASEEGISLRELGGAIDKKLGRLMPHAYLDVGRMMREPTDIVLRVDIPERDESGQAVEAWARGLLGHGYAASMKPSPLIGRIVRMEGEIDHGEDTLEHKLRYLIWFN